ncbi:MAG: orotate phosphoribosyltransferase [Thelocarpon impressellum]|nr:MAG: orotate phosphoribosyltransferase [Thelocarpon impressellum]
MADAPRPSQAAFLRACLVNEILRFGTFQLKSGRVSPYFFNAGLVHRADILSSMSAAYASTILASSAALGDIDVLFGPAYKGIPLATSTVGALAALAPERFGKVSYAFNRKEAKTHGEGGTIVGAPLAGKRVLIIDDVITAGTAIREAVAMIAAEGGVLAGIVVALDRQERVGPPPGEADDGVEGEVRRKSAIGQVRAELGVPVLAVLTLDDIIAGLAATGSGSDPAASAENVSALEQYRRRYKAGD